MSSEEEFEISGRTSLTKMVSDIKEGILKIKDNIIQSLEWYNEFLQTESFLQTEQESVDEIISGIKDNDKLVRSLGDSLEQLSVKILSLQAPVGHDLRLVLSSFRIIYDLQRISRDMLHSFGDITILAISNQRYLESQIELFKTCLNATSDLLQIFTRVYSMKSTDRHNFDYQSVIDESEAQDDRIDNVFEEGSKKIIKKAKESNLDAGKTHQILSSIRSLERVGDHCCNIIERSIYIITGEKVIIK